MLTLLAIIFLIWLVFGYFAYGRWIAKQFKLDDARETQANVVKVRLPVRLSRVNFSAGFPACSGSRSAWF
jgi:hypothetical protein